MILVACGSPDPAPTAVTTPGASPSTATTASAARRIIDFEGTVDPVHQTLSLRYAAPTHGGLHPESWLPYGTAAGDVYFHTCSVTWTGGATHTLSGTVQAVNLLGGTITSLNAVVDSVNGTGITPSSGVISSYGTVAPNTADCSTTTSWSFNVPSGSQFTFQGHAEGNLPGVVASYALSEGSGTTAADATGNGHTGTLSSATWASPGITFSGADASNMIAPSFAELGTSASYSFAMWVKPVANAGVLIHVSSGSTGSGWCVPFVGFNGSGQLVSQHLYGSSSASFSVATDATALPLNSWSHVATTYSSTTGTTKLYVNGTLVGNATQAGSDPNGSAVFVTWGSNNTAGGGCWHGSIGAAPFHGTIDLPSVYNVELTPTEISGLAASPP